jgi:hypothetical protein
MDIPEITPESSCSVCTRKIADHSIADVDRCAAELAVRTAAHRENEAMLQAQTRRLRRAIAEHIGQN